MPAPRRLDPLILAPSERRFEVTVEAEVPYDQIGELKRQVGRIAGESTVTVGNEILPAAPSILLEALPWDTKTGEFRFAVTDSAIQEFVDAEFGRKYTGLTIADRIWVHYWSTHVNEQSSFKQVSEYRARWCPPMPVNFTPCECGLEVMRRRTSKRQGVRGFEPFSLIKCIELHTAINGLGNKKRPILNEVAHRLRIDLNYFEHDEVETDPVI